MQKGLSNHFFPAVDGTSFHFNAGAGGDITILPVVAPCTLCLRSITCCCTAGLPIAPASPISPPPISSTECRKLHDIKTDAALKKLRLSAGYRAKNKTDNTFEEYCRFWRHHPESNRGIKVLQTSALPLGYGAKKMERVTRLELATSTLARWRSTR